MIADYARLAFRSISHRKLRSWLTLIGILIGITAVVALISISVGMQNAIQAEFEEIGSNRIVIAPGGYFFGPGSTGYSTATFDNSDLKAVKSVRGIEAAVPVLSKTVRLKFREQETSTQIIGGPTDAETLKVTSKIDVFQIAEGRQMDTGDDYVITISQGIAYDTFERDIRVGNNVKINGIDFKVIGIGEEAHVIGSSSIIPLDTAREIFDEPDEISNIFVMVKRSFVPAEVAEDIKKELRKERNVKEGEE
ncbi:MAG: ABC transporter permease, partial [Nanoarchaeota archaeon]|nr:ABC transporter permease [Nanoarchaeota archaeon]